MTKSGRSRVHLSGTALRSVLTVLTCVWVSITLVLFAFWWTEWDHSAVRQRLIYCASALSLEEESARLMSAGSVSLQRFPAFHSGPIESRLRSENGGHIEVKPMAGTTGAHAPRLGIVSMPPSRAPTAAVDLQTRTEVTLAVAKTAPARPIVTQAANPPSDRLNVRRADGIEVQATTSAKSTDDWLMVLVLSAPPYVERREAARRVWNWAQTKKWEGLPPLPLSYKFVCGLSADGAVNRDVRLEKEKRGDLLVVDILDSYKALAKKVLWAFQWALSNVHFQFLMKTDDDVFVNIRELFLNVFLPLDWRESQKKFYYGSTVGRYKEKGVVIKRDPRSKWYVPRSVYQRSHFPPYSQGHGYILSRTLVNVTICSAASRAVIEVEDAYIGVLMHENSVKPMHNEHFHDRLTQTACNDTQAILIGGLMPRELNTVLDNMENKVSLCSGILPIKILKY